MLVPAALPPLAAALPEALLEGLLDALLALLALLLLALLQAPTRTASAIRLAAATEVRLARLRFILLLYIYG